MIQTEDGKRVWESYDEYLKDQSQALAIRARFEVMLYLQGLDSDFLEQTPEAQAMKEIESDILQQAEAALKAVEALEKEEAEIEKTKTKPKKKAAKKPAKKPAKKTTKKAKTTKPDEDKDE
jgi:hypothetical protein